MVKGEAIIEMALASGLVTAGGASSNDAVNATTAGTGQLIAEAVRSGARRVIVAAGGSASTDGGLGAIRALAPEAQLRGVELLVACDVRTRFVDAAATFAPQKGASPAQVRLLGRRLERLAQMYLDDYGVDVTTVTGSGAAGGLAGGLVALGAQLVNGFRLVADQVGLEDRVNGASLVVTGEGRLDDTSFEGKVVGGVARLAAAAGVPAVAVVGSVGALSETTLDDLDKLGDMAGLGVIDLTRRFGASQARSGTTDCITEAVAGALDNWHPPRGGGRDKWLAPR